MKLLNKKGLLESLYIILFITVIINFFYDTINFIIDFQLSNFIVFLITNLLFMTFLSIGMYFLVKRKNISFRIIVYILTIGEAYKTMFNSFKEINYLNSNNELLLNIHYGLRVLITLLFILFIILSLFIFLSENIYNKLNKVTIYSGFSILGIELCDYILCIILLIKYNFDYNEINHFYNIILLLIMLVLSRKNMKLEQEKINNYTNYIS